jgi:hypothetical protein
MVGYTVVLLVPLEHSVAATCHRLFLPQAALSGRVGGVNRSAQVVVRGCEAR